MYLRQQEAQEGDRGIVMKGYARTIIGVHEHQMLTIVEYPSPAVFAAMGKSDARRRGVRSNEVLQCRVVPPSTSDLAREDCRGMVTDRLYHERTYLGESLQKLLEGLVLARVSC